MTTNGEPVPSPQERWEKEDTWQSLAIAAAVILLVGFVCSCIWVIGAPDDKARLLRVQISAPFGVFGGAVVTFCTIVWRGLISKRQADAQLKATNLQREQIDKLALQISATEENNLAQLLHKAAELVAEIEKPAQVSAGIAILQSVATDGNGKFAGEAMNLLADYVKNRIVPGTGDPFTQSALSALSAGADIGRKAKRALTLRISDYPEEMQKRQWPTVRGVDLVVYWGGRLSLTEEHFDLRFNPIFRSNRVLFDSGLANFSRASYWECEFDDVQIVELSTSDWGSNSFRRCDFSDAVVRGSNELTDLRAGQNYFNPSHPPIFDQDVEASDVLCVGRPFKDISIPF